MSKKKLFNIHGVEWTDWKDGMRFCIFKPNTNATFQYTEMPPGATVDLHSHPAQQIIYIQNGFAEAVIGGTLHTMGPGSICYIPSHVVHQLTNQGNSTVTVIDIFLPARNDREESKTVKEISHSL